MTGSSPAGATVAIGQWQSGRLWICLRGFDSPWSHYGWVCLAARAADCKSVTQKHRRFESCPIHFPFACPRGLWCLSVPLRSSQSGCPPDILRPAKVACGNAPKVRILPQTLQGRDGIPGIFMQEPPKRKGPAAASPFSFFSFISGKV